MTPLTRQWLRKAEDDRRLAALAMRGRPPLYDGACYHCQQAVEKYLKGLMNEFGLPVPKIHNLEDLLSLLLPRDATLRSLQRVMSRDCPTTPSSTATLGCGRLRRQALAAQRKMERVRAEIRRRLGLRL